MSFARVSKRDPRRRPCHLSAERLEGRRLLAADLTSATRQLVWDGETIATRADSWIVSTDGTAPRTPSGWSSRSLGFGSFAITAPGASVSDVNSWARSTGARSLEPDRILTAAALPNDPSFYRLWGLHNTGQTGGVADADIDAAEAWDVTTGSRSVVVAVIDGGIDYRHPDLAANMWRNPGEIAGDRIDNDGNGFVDDVYGWDFANNDSDPFDDRGHGTHVAGTIGAVGNNGVGSTGVNWQVSLMALKFLDATGSGSTSAAVAALNYATMMRQTYGVNVVVTNNSWGGGGASSALNDAIVAGGNAGILAVAAAGNEAANNDSTPVYPANVNSTAVISVAATDASNRLASFSNYGATTVDVAAPGVGIYSTTPNNSYSSFSGTSMAAPHVAGLVALMAATNPQATAGQIRSAILSTSVPIASLAGNVATGGLVNAAAAVNAIRGLGPPPSPPPPATSSEPNDSIATVAAVALSSGAATVTGTIGDGPHPDRDVDLYALTVRAGGVLTVDIDAVALGSGLDSYVTIFTAAGTRVAFNDDYGRSYDSFVSYTAPTTGTYYVGVSAYGNSSYSPWTAGSGMAAVTTGAYTATITVSEPVLPPTADIIDVAPDPRTTPVSAVVVQFSRAVTGVGPSDFTLTRNDAVVSLAGATVTTTDSVRWTLAGLDAFTAPAGSYVLTLNASGSGIVAVDDGAALVTSVSEAWTMQTVVDAGDTMALATVLGITSGEVRRSGIIGDGAFGSKDVDMYRVTLAAGQTIKIDIDAQTLPGGSSLDSYLRLFDASGRQIAANDDDGVKLDSLLSFRATVAGRYFVGISGFSNSRYHPARQSSGSAGSTGVYEVRFALPSPTTGPVGLRIAGFPDSATSAWAAAFAGYGGNVLDRVAISAGVWSSMVARSLGPMPYFDRRVASSSR